MVLNFHRFRTELRPLLVFTTADICKVDPTLNDVNLSPWRNKDYITKLTKGGYTFGNNTIDRSLLFYNANRLTNSAVAD